MFGKGVERVIVSALFAFTGAQNGKDEEEEKGLLVFTHMAVTDVLDTDTIIGRIADGATQAELAKEHGISVGSLNHWLHANPERSARARDAMRMSAEAWLDRGMAYLLDAEPDGAEIARARALEQHCARRAAIRDPKRYGDKLTLQGDDENPLRQVHQISLVALK